MKKAKDHIKTLLNFVKTQTMSFHLYTSCNVINRVSFHAQNFTSLHL